MAKASKKIPKAEADKTKSKLTLKLLKAEAQKEYLKLQEQEYKNMKAELAYEMYHCGLEEFVVDDGSEKVLSAKAYEANRVKYDLDAMVEKLPPEILDDISDVRYVLTFDDIKSIVKKYPEVRNMLSKKVEKEYIINEQELSHQLEKGYLSIEELEGCYTIDKSECFKIQRVNPSEYIETDEE